MLSRQHSGSLRSTLAVRCMEETTRHSTSCINCAMSPTVSATMYALPVSRFWYHYSKWHCADVAECVDDHYTAQIGARYFDGRQMKTSNACMTSPSWSVRAMFLRLNYSTAVSSVDSSAIWPSLTRRREIWDCGRFCTSFSLVPLVTWSARLWVFECYVCSNVMFVWLFIDACTEDVEQHLLYCLIVFCQSASIFIQNISWLLLQVPSVTELPRHWQPLETAMFRSLVTKLMLCFHHLEQVYKTKTVHYNGCYTNSITILLY